MSQTSPTPNSFTLHDLLIEQSKDLYDAVREYSTFLADINRSSRDDHMREILTKIAMDTVKNISDLESVCEILEVDPGGVRCEAMAGLLREGKETTQEYDSGAVKDAALIANAQRIAHYEIAGFGTAEAFAKQLSLSSAASLFEDMLERSVSNDRALTKLATGTWLTSGINQRAAQEN